MQLDQFESNKTISAITKKDPADEAFMKALATEQCRCSLLERVMVFCCSSVADL